MPKNKQAILRDLRSIYPEAGVLNMAQIERYTGKGREYLQRLLEKVQTVCINAKKEYLLIDVVDAIWHCRI